MKTKILILKNDEVYKYDELSNSILGMKGRLDLPNRLWFVLFEKEWLGFGGYRKIDNERIYFGPTMIREKYRGLGLQRKLIRARLQAAKKDGYKEAISSIYSYNYTSGNNLLSEGFRLCGIPAYYDMEPDEVWFKKVLNV